MTNIHDPNRSRYLIKPGEIRNKVGRPKGSRNKLSESFLRDFHEVWRKEGKKALETVARERPDILVRVAASILPKQLDISHETTVDPIEFADRFRKAYELLGNRVPHMTQQRRKPMKVINGQGIAETISED